MMQWPHGARAALSLSFDDARESQAARGLAHLDALNVKGMVVHGLEVPMDQVFLASVYGVSYTLIVLALAVLVFRRRDFL